VVGLKRGRRRRRRRRVVRMEEHEVEPFIEHVVGLRICHSE